MSYQNNSNNFSDVADEIAFEVNELFFSRTDDRGVIQAGNEVFRRLSGYSWEELIGAPHKVIRHSDMPKGVFHILWDRIKQGKATGAYVKNKSKCGKYYWVYAVVSPIEGGFVSVRLKPTSEVLPQVQELYQKVLEAEEEGLSPEDSAQYIRKSLNEQGFPTYAAFSSYALSQELSVRDEALGHVPDSRLRALKDLLPELVALDESQSKLFEYFSAIRGIPSNMRIVASRLEPAGGPISAISQNYRLMSEEVTGQLLGFRDLDDISNMSTVLLRRVYVALFMLAASRLQREVNFIAKESISKGEETEAFEKEADILGRILLHYSGETAKSLMGIANDIAALRRNAKDLRQSVTGLDSIRVLCRVEAGRLGASSAPLDPIIDQLDKFHILIDQTLEKIMDHSEAIKRLVDASLPRTVTGSVRHSNLHL